MSEKALIIHTSKRQAAFGALNLACRIGRLGTIAQEDGREGDKKTPLGEYILRFGLYRADRLPVPPSQLTFWPIEKSDGWCDDVSDPAYNRFVRLPYPSSHEVLWRDDGAYDVILVLSHNDSPPKPNLGSAVFIHAAQPDDRQTLGCVAFAPNEMAALIPHLTTGLPVHIQE